MRPRAAVARDTHGPRCIRSELIARFARGRIEVPPLHARTEDIIPLARAFLAASGASPPPRLSTEAADLLLADPWIGNVSALRASMECALAEAGPETALIGPEVIARVLEDRDAPLPAIAPPTDASGEEGPLLRARLRELERQRLLLSLARAHGNKTRAARELKIARKTLYERLRRHGILETE